MFIMDTTRFMTIKRDPVRYQGLTCVEWAARLNMHATHVRHILRRDGNLSAIGKQRTCGRRRIQTPYGVYDSISQASKSIGVSRALVQQYLKQGKPGYSYVV